METNYVSTMNINNNNNKKNQPSSKRQAEAAGYAWPERAEQIKRFKVTNKYAELQSPSTHLANSDYMQHFTPKLQQQTSFVTLSPITELVKNLHGTALNTPKNMASGELVAAGTGKRLKQFRILQSEFDADGADDTPLLQTEAAILEQHPSTLRSFKSLSSSSSNDSNSLEDEYLSLYEMEQHVAGAPDNVNVDIKAPLQLPSDLNKLINGTLSLDNIVQAVAPELCHPRVRRCLSLVDINDSTEPAASLVSTTESVSADLKCLNDAAAHEAIAKTNDSGTPMRSRTAATVAKDDAAAQPATGQRVLRKALSLNDAEIMTALARSEQSDEPTLIGDFSKPYALPLLNPGKTRHRDLPTISGETLSQLLAGVYNTEVHSYHIIDCRYPYEYDGGHIKGADNLYSQKQLIDRFPMQAPEPCKTGDAAAVVRQIIVFHCEFSSERGPKLLRFLRNNDRTMHMHVYPELAYPELYLLHNGYKAFYESHAALCEPNGYVPMLSPMFNEAYRVFRAKSKSWQAEIGFGGTAAKPKKFRSRLALE